MYWASSSTSSGSAFTSGTSNFAWEGNVTHTTTEIYVDASCECEVSVGESEPAKEEAVDDAPEAEAQQHVTMKPFSGWRPEQLLTPEGWPSGFV